MRLRTYCLLLKRKRRLLSELFLFNLVKIIKKDGNNPIYSYFDEVEDIRVSFGRVLALPFIEPVFIPNHLQKTLVKREIVEFLFLILFKALKIKVVFELKVMVL